MAPAATRQAVSRADARPGAPPIAQAVFHLIGVVGVAGPELVLDLAVVLGPRIHIGDLEGDRRSGGELRAAFVVEHAGEDTHLVGLLALGGVFRLARFAFVEKSLDLGFGDGDAGRAAIDHAADRRPVAFAPGGDAEQMAEAVMRHGPLMRACLYFVITGKPGTTPSPRRYPARPRPSCRPRGSPRRYAGSRRSRRGRGRRGDRARPRRHPRWRRCA